MSRYSKELRWLNANGWFCTPDHFNGKIYYQDPDNTIEKGVQILEASSVFHENRGMSPSHIADRLSDFAHDRYCPECKMYHDPDNMVTIEIEESIYIPNYLCQDCHEASMEDTTDPYEARGLYRSDFY